MNWSKFWGFNKSKAEVNASDDNSKRLEFKGKGIKFNATAFGKGYFKRTIDGSINTAYKVDKIWSYKGVSSLHESYTSDGYWLRNRSSSFSRIG